MKAARLATLASIVALLVGVEGHRRGWHSPAAELAAPFGLEWFVVMLGAGLAGAATYIWGLSWSYAKPKSLRRKGMRLRLARRTGIGSASPGPRRWRDRVIHSGLQGISAAAGAAATFLVIPGGSGIGEGAIGGALPPDVTAAALDAVPPSAVVALIAALSAAGSWWGWDRFGNE